MADTTTPVINLALIRIGVKPIKSYTDNSPAAIVANACYSHILQRVLQEKDWRFAKLRATLTRHTIAPLYGYLYAYALPSDFLRLSANHYPQTNQLNPAAYVSGNWYGIIDSVGYPSYYRNYDPNVYPGGCPFIFEVIPGVAGPPAVADKFCLLTDYDDTDTPIMIDYIRSVTDETIFTPAFKELFVIRLAQEFAYSLCESGQKKNDMQSDYERQLNSAEAINESYDNVEDETGSTAWENAR
jgi:hypothetical protein